MTTYRLPQIKALTALRILKPADPAARSGLLMTQILAGVTLAALMIPLNIGYAQVAGLSPIVGLYAAIAPMIAFAIFSTSRNFIAGPDAPIVALIGSALLMFAFPNDPRYQELALGLAFLSAIFLLVFWFFRLGFLANFLSRAVLIGFISGLGIEILTSQVQKIMGIHVEAERWLGEVWLIIRSIPLANIYSVLIGVGTIVLIRLLKRYAPKIPGALVALILGTLIVSWLGLDQLGVSVLGEIPAGLPSFHLPQIGWNDYLSMIPIALAVVGITMAEGLLLDRKYANKYGDKADPDMDLFALGAANLAAGLTGSLVVGSSASRTAAMDNAGMRTQIPSLVGAIVVAFVLLFLTDLLALVPNALLAGIVANAVLALVEVSELRELRRQRRTEFWIALVCLAAVLAIGPLPAVIIAFLLSAVEVVRRAASPHTSLLRLRPDGSGYYAGGDGADPMAVPGLLLYRFGAELFFGNATAFQEEVKQIAENAGQKVNWFVLDAEAISDIDTTGAEALEHVTEYLAKRDITIALTRASEPVPELLGRYELLDKIGADRLYATNRQAVEAYCRENGQVNAPDKRNGEGLTYGQPV
jgi:sulfate permease, SulP family